MTDNLKQRIVDVIDAYEQTTLWANSDGKAQAVLDIVEPMFPKWMPIDSAPKDETTFIGAVFDDGIFVKCFDSQYIAKWNVFSCNPTHWQPLPTPPEKE